MAARLTAVAVALIVGVTLVAGLIVGAQRDDDSGPIDLLIYNGRVYTGDAQAPFAEAVAIRGNRIYRVGSNREIKRLRRRATTVIDAHGGSVLPGFSDAHARLPIVEAAGRGRRRLAQPAGERCERRRAGLANRAERRPRARRQPDRARPAARGRHRRRPPPRRDRAQHDCEGREELQAYEELRTRRLAAAARRRRGARRRAGR